MTKQGGVSQTKKVNRYVISVLIVVLFVCVSIITALELKRNEVEIQEKFANEYYLAVSEKSLTALAAISDYKIWIMEKYYDAKTEEGITESKILQISDDILVRDKYESLIYQLRKYVRQIDNIQNKNQNEDFEKTTSLLLKRLNELESGYESDDLYTYRNVIQEFNEELTPIKILLHQLNRMHKQEYDRTLMRVDQLRNNSQKQILYLLATILITGVVTVIFLVKQIQYYVRNLLDANTEVKRSQARFKSIFESMSDAVVVADLNRKITVVNSSVNTIFGYSSEELLGNTTKILYANDDDYKRAGTKRFNIDAEGNRLPYSVRYRRKNGSEFWGETLGTKIVTVEGDVIGFLGIIRDITERKQTEDLVKLSEQRLNEAQKLAKVGSWELDLLTGELIWSDEIFHMFDIEKSKFSPTYEAFIGTIHPDDRDMVNQAYSDSLVNQKPYEIVHRLEMQDGTIKYVRETCQSYFDDDNKPLRSVGTVQDITEMYLVEVELERHQKDLEKLIVERTRDLKSAQDELVRKERLATLGQLTATVSHELRNPLGAMRPSLYLIEKKSDLSDERMKNAIQRVERNINRCDQIIDELLDFTRIIDLNSTPTNICDWLNRVIDDQVIPEGITVEKNISLKNIEVNIDTDRLSRAVINVYDNACHSMMDDARTVSDHVNSRVIITAEVTVDRLEIIISDTGKGIPAELLDKVFEPLFSTKGFGVGLGMPTVKQIMEQHNGGVIIDSEEGVGTAVTLWVPLSV